MSTFGIICEFNPLHNGHKRLIDRARTMGAERIVCVMSGNAVQRGELAVVDKYARAKAAVLCGADLVLELPYPWSAASAEYFATAGVEILSHLCDNIIFGSECGDIDLLKRAAETAVSIGFKETFRKKLTCGEGAASAYFSALEESVDIGLGSNDLLGIEYIKAAMENGYNIQFHTIKREGAAYNDTELGTDICPSATAIRMAWKDGRDAWEHIPDEARNIFRDCIENGDITDHRELSRAVLMYLRLTDAEALTGIADTDGGISNRLISTALRARNGEEFFELLRTKRYTDAKLRRAVLFSLTHVRLELLRRKPDYAVLLGADEQGRELLSERRKNCGFTLVTKAADAPSDSEQYRVGERLEAIFTLARKNSGDVGASYRKSAFIK